MLETTIERWIYVPNTQQDTAEKELKPVYQYDSDVEIKVEMSTQIEQEDMRSLALAVGFKGALQPLDVFKIPERGTLYIPSQYLAAGRDLVFCVLAEDGCGTRKTLARYILQVIPSFKIPDAKGV